MTTNNAKLNKRLDTIDKIQKNIIDSLGDEMDDVVRAGKQAIKELEDSVSYCVACNCMTTTVLCKCGKCGAVKVVSDDEGD